MPKSPLGINVYEASKERISYVFNNFPRIYVSFSGGKDSTVMLHMVMKEAKKRNRKIGVLFIDWEAQFKITIDFIKTMCELYKDFIELYWVSLPLTTTNACSMFEPEWICWEPSKKDIWVRPPEAISITDETYFDFYTHAMTFEEFVPAFGHWYSNGKLTACFVGIRSDESLNRFRTIAADKSKFDNKQWTTWCGKGVYNVYPIYDWKTQDDWIFHGKTGLPYNTLYDLMHKAGLSIHQMRICEPYGDEQRKGLHLYHVIEPESWGKVVARVAGANTGALYAKESGNIMGNIRVKLPDGHSWESFVKLILNTMPLATAEHYKNKISVWIHWYEKHGVKIQDEIEGDQGPKDMPSWRRVCKMLLKNDYWCKTICFSPTKSTAYTNYKKIMKKRREQWGYGFF